MTAEIILASSSPRRRELLALLGIPFRTEPSQFIEPAPPTCAVPVADLVCSLASEKSLEVANRLALTDVLVLGADTLVTMSHDTTGIPMGKPKDDADAIRMISELSGNSHLVYTGICLTKYSEGKASVLASRVERTAVSFRKLTQSMIQGYVETGEPLDKAGAYGAQGYAAPFIESFSGDFYNVVGLPLCTLCMLFEDVGFEWWKHRNDMPSIIG